MSSHGRSCPHRTRSRRRKRLTTRKPSCSRPAKASRPPSDRRRRHRAERREQHQRRAANQTSQQIGAATLVNPATNLSRVTLPADGIDSVSVMSNPYEVEFGRFSSGLVTIQMRRAGDDWKVRVNNLEPNLRVKRYTVFDVNGVVAWKPSVEFGGPIVKDRVFMEQTAQDLLPDHRHQQPSENELAHDGLGQLADPYRRQPLGASRADGQRGVRARQRVERHARHLHPARRDGRHRQPLQPRDADGTGQIAGGTFLESMLEFHTYDTSVHGKGPAVMQLLPDDTLGNFFNRQDRSTTSFQWVETASDIAQWPPAACTP